jgi:hypothetical protein
VGIRHGRATVSGTSSLVTEVRNSAIANTIRTGRRYPEEVFEVNPAAAAPTPIPLKDLRPVAFAAALAFLVLYLVAFDQGTLSQTGSFLHELAHDGRHLLGIPCH